jgi:adenylate kinase
VLRALLLAPPGAGKGTQGDRLSEIYGVPHLATGELLRAQVEEGSAAGEMAKGFMERGELVPDELVVGLVLEKITQPKLLSGFILDGFPRTITQARLAYEWATTNDRTFHAVISLDVPMDELIERLVGRGSRGTRSDDEVSIIRTRMRVYSASTEPLLEFYRQRRILIEIDGTGAVDAVTQRIRLRLDELEID